MLDLGLIATIGFIHLVALISPGPDFVVACRNTLLYSRTIGIYTAIGFGLGILVHISYAVFGLSWLIANHAFVFAIIQYMGAAYLIYIGVQSLRDFESKVESNTTASPHSMAAVKAVDSTDSHQRSQCANEFPKRCHWGDVAVADSREGDDRPPHGFRNR